MEKRLNILVLEDSEDDFNLINYTLRKEGLVFISQCVDAKEQFKSALHEFRPDVILSDHGLPQFNSMEALKLCREAGLKIPFILVTGTVSEEFAVTSLKHGADDYILKSNLARLPSAIMNAVKQRHLEKKKKKAETSLRKQNTELTKINKELDSFVYSVSHNLRAPLMSVLGLVNLVQIEDQKAMSSGSKEQLFDMMRSSIHKLDETLKEILDYSKNARSDLHITPVDIRKVIDDCFENMKYIPGASEVHKVIDIHEAAPLNSDHYRLMVIFNNLISNSIKYKDPQKKESAITIEGMITSETMVIYFKDNGIGVSKDTVERIFEMFFRATDLSEGSGLGLYIVKETVDKLEGTISVDSELGIGTTFKIIIPNLTPEDTAG
ncbi:MAG TPA: ATP-binding protein [Ohtaekwangia sp.]|nr:ATP-binding protein [Ohtaekwangia sp.]